MYIAFLLFLFFIYIVESITEYYFIISDPSFSVSIYLFITIFFLYKNRRESLFCAETLLFIFGFIIFFFDEIVIKNMDISIVSRLYTGWPISLDHKSVHVSMLAVLSLLIGGELACLKSRFLHQKNNHMQVRRNSTIDYNIICVILSLIIFIYLLVLLFTGQLYSFMKYDGRYADLYEGNTQIVYITILQFTNTIFEGERLKTKGCFSFVDILKKINKLYLFNFIVFSLFFILSGNRSESLLIVFPFIIIYSVYFKKISNKLFLIGVIAGFSLMVILGLTRGSDSSLGESIKTTGVYDLFRDFGPAAIAQKGLIQYTDDTKPVYFSDGILTLISSVPFLGGAVKDIFSIESGKRSSILATEQFQLSSNMDSGLGTSLVGDLYYSGKIYFVILYMFFLGYLLSVYFFRFYVTKKYNVYHLVIYVWLFSDIIYLLRAEWYSLFRYIGFSMLLIFLFTFLFRHKRL